MSQALSNQTTAGTAVTSGAQAGYSVDVGGVVRGQHACSSLIPMRRIRQHTVTIVALGAGGTLPAQTGQFEQSR